MKTKFGSIVIISLLLVATLVSGCADVYEQSSSPKSTYIIDEDYADSSARNAVMDEAGYSSDYGGDYDEASTTSVERKTITTIDMTIEVDDAAASIEEISRLAAASGGYVSNSYIYDSYYNSNTGKAGYVTVRVPESDYPTFLENVGNLGEVTSKSVNSQDVTEEYIDVSARLDNLERQEVRLQEILNMTETVDEVLSVEAELERVRGEIESLTGRLNYLNDRTEFSTITINVREPTPITHSWGIRAALSESVNGFITMVNTLIILVGYLLPVIVVIVLFAGAGILVRRRLRR